MKKKIISILLMVVMVAACFAITGCSKSKENPYIGVWNATTFNIDGYETTPEDSGLTFSLEFKDDGTVVAVTNGESDGSAKWEATDDGFVVNDNGTEMPGYVDSEGVMHFTLSDIEMTLVKE